MKYGFLTWPCLLTIAAAQRWSNCTIIETVIKTIVVETPEWVRPFSYSACQTCPPCIITDLNQAITSPTVRKDSTFQYIAPYWEWNFHRTRTVIVEVKAPQTTFSQIQTWLARTPYISGGPMTRGGTIYYVYHFEQIVRYVLWGQWNYNGIGYDFDSDDRSTVTTTTTFTSIFTNTLPSPQTVDQTAFSAPSRSDSLQSTLEHAVYTGSRPSASSPSNASVSFMVTSLPSGFFSDGSFYPGPPNGRTDTGIEQTSSNSDEEPATSSGKDSGQGASEQSITGDISPKGPSDVSVPAMERSSSNIVGSDSAMTSSYLKPSTTRASQQFMNISTSSGTILDSAESSPTALATTTDSASNTASPNPTTVYTDSSSSEPLPGMSLPNGAENRTFQLYVKNNVSGLNQLPVGEQGTARRGQLIVGGVSEATVLTINTATNMTDDKGCFIYFVPKTTRPRLSRRQDRDPTLRYSDEPPDDAVTSGFSLDGILLGANTTDTNYTFYTCSRSPDAQPIYVAEVGLTPPQCYNFDLVTEPPPLNETNDTTTFFQSDTPFSSTDISSLLSNTDTPTSSVSSSVSSNVGITQAPTSSELVPSSSTDVSGASSAATTTIATIGSSSTTSTTANAGGATSSRSSVPEVDTSSSLERGSTSANPPVTTPTSSSTSVNAATPISSKLAVPSIKQSVDSFKNQGLFNGPGPQVLAQPSQVTTTQTMSPEYCANLCSGRSYMGLSDGDTCFCADAVNDQASLAADQSGGSNVACTGIKSEYCGGQVLIQVYSSTSDTSSSVLGTSVSSLDSAAESGSETATGDTPASSDGGTITSIPDSSRDSGVSDSNTGISTAYTEVSSPPSESASTSIGDASSIEASITSGSDLSVTSSNQPTSSSAAPTIVQTGDRWTNKGLYNSDSGASFLDSGLSQKITSASMSFGYCADQCSAYNYFGLYKGDTCFCGNVLTSQPTLASDQSGSSDTACVGDASELCGGPGLVQLYSKTKSSPSSSDSASSATSSGITATSDVSSIVSSSSDDNASSETSLSSASFATATTVSSEDSQSSYTTTDSSSASSFSDDQTSLSTEEISTEEASSATADTESATTDLQETSTGAITSATSSSGGLITDSFSSEATSDASESSDSALSTSSEATASSNPNPESETSISKLSSSGDISSEVASSIAETTDSFPAAPSEDGSLTVGTTSGSGASSSASASVDSDSSSANADVSVSSISAPTSSAGVSSSSDFVDSGTITESPASSSFAVSSDSSISPSSSSLPSSSSSSSSSSSVDHVAAATSIIESQKLQPFCSSYLGYTTPSTTVTATATIVQSTTTTLGAVISTQGTTTVTTTQTTTVPATTLSPTTTVTSTTYVIVAKTVTQGAAQKRDLDPRQAAASTSTSSLATPSALQTFAPSILSSACSLEATPVSATATATQPTTTTRTETLSTTTSSISTYTIITITTSRTNTITSGATTLSTVTTTTTTTLTSTTTITIASNAPSAPPNYLKIDPDPNTNANWALSDPAAHMTDNYNAISNREVFSLTSVGQLYSITNSAWYGVVPGTVGRTSGKVYWDSRSQYGNKTFFGKALNDGTGRTQLFLNNTATGVAYLWCVATVASGDSNGNTGFHIYFYVTSSQVTQCAQTNLYLSPVGNG